MGTSAWTPVNESAWTSVQEQIPAKEPPSPSVAERVRGGASDLIQGVGEGALNTVSGISGLVNKIPYVGETLAPKEGIKALQSIATPDPGHPLQKVGKYGEQIGEFMLPGAGEEALAGKVASKIPILGRAAEPLARVATGALSSGAVNKLQGGEFSSGAEAGAAGGALGEAGRVLAPKAAETALRVTDQMRGRGRDIGRAALDETSGIRPATIAREAQSALANRTGEMEGAVKAATAGGAMGSTTPAHQALNEIISTTPRNAQDVIQKLEDLRGKLALPGASGNAYTPEDLLEIKRGIGQSVKTWPKEWQQLDKVKQAQQRLYGSLDKELDRLVPGNAEANQKISSLIPVKQQATRISASAPLSQRIVGRIGAHTGALAGAGLGAGLGYERGGPQGALIGGVSGLAIPELVASPSVQMLGARMLNSGTPARVARAIPLQFDRKSEEDEPEENAKTAK